MYKVFLCLRYLRSRVIAYFAVLSVLVCVAMMLIVVSVMNGFLHKIEIAAKGLFGDIVMDSVNGIGHYDEFIAEVERKVPEVQAASPFILTIGMLRVPGTDYQQHVSIAGIRLPQQVKVTAFAEGLFVQRGQQAPTFDAPIQLLLDRLEDDAEAIRAIHARQSAASAEKTIEERVALDRKFETALDFNDRARQDLLAARPHQQKMRQVQDKLNAAYAEARGETTEAITRLSQELENLKTAAGGYQTPDYNVILGLGIPGLSFRTEQGETIRTITAGSKVVLSLMPLGQALVDTANVSPTSATFNVVDDCKTDVSTIDSEMVYIRLETLQRMHNMSAEYDVNGELYRPARCSQIHFKVKSGFSKEEQLSRIAGQIQGLWRKFSDRHRRVWGDDVQVQTWRRRQAKLIGTIESQRTLTVIIVGIVSLVSVVLIFVMFYMIVFQKTRDIGVVKAIGASGSGVAAIFLAYGGAIGLLGSALGAAAGYYFVRHINPIHDWIGRTFGFAVWSRETFMFEEIPSEVEWTSVVVIMAGAMLAGVFGALIPAIVAARMEPVEALRYE